MFSRVLLLALFVGAAFGALRVDRAPLDEFEARVQPNFKDCTAIYTVTVEPRYTVQGNDLGILPTHGKDTTVTPEDPEYAHFHAWTNGGTSRRTFGGNFVGEPFRNDPARQAAAEAQESVTALTEVDATPLGFHRDTLRMYHYVCVNVRGVYDRWVEIMGETLQPDQQLCVQDWNRPNLAENVFQESCGNGKLYTCRESVNSVVSEGVYEDNMGLRFYCRDSCDDPDFEFYWRIVAHQETPTFVTTTDEDGNESSRWQNPDGENWCAFRAGDDFPSSLLRPYPVNYDPPAVFERAVSSAASTMATLVSCVLLAAMAIFLL